MRLVLVLLETILELMGKPRDWFDLVGGTRVEGAPDPGPGAPTIHIRAFSLVGGIRIRRDGPGRRSAAERLDRGTDRRAELLDRRAERHERLADRRAERRSRRGRYGGM